MRSIYKTLVVKSEEKRPPEGPGCTRKDKIKIDLKEIKREGVD
jgi:hypothetical protein